MVYRCFLVIQVLTLGGIELDPKRKVGKVRWVNSEVIRGEDRQDRVRKGEEMRTKRPLEISYTH